MDILTQVFAGLILAVIITLATNLWKHRDNFDRAFGGWHVRVWQKIKFAFTKKEPEEETEARRYRKMIESDDPDIWKPLK